MKKLFSLLFFCNFLLASAHAFPFHHKHAPMLKAHVRFLATGELIRVAQGLSHDEYLVSVSTHSSAEQQQVARLVDDYINFAPPIPQNVQTSAKLVTFELVRDSTCDLPYHAMMLRSAPGDLIALYPAPTHYTPVLDEAIAPATVIPCYRTVRKSGLVEARLSR